MKLAPCTLLTTSVLAAASTITPSLDTTYQIRLSSSNRAINNTLVTVKDEAPANTSPNAMGTFSTGNPRYPYTFKFVHSHLSKVLYELQGTVRKTHLVLTGNQVALGLYDIPIGTDPKPAEDELTASDKFWVNEENGKMSLMAAERYTGDDSKLLSASSWRACKGDSEIDYTLYWYDGLNRLEDYVKGCEGGITLYVEEAQSAATTSGFLTGVTAPTATPTGYCPGGPAANSTATAGVKPTGSSTPFESSAGTVVAGSLVGLAGAVMAFLV
ncbi:hypothetical protein BU23DRAFT_572350 [Bimuria novae-zelandiae CBS 107.79]|uniref:Uncharacterized protein n=1 Tax=Bimuria novae-zelandiae CBS 107.79 TaxID=1447943 RepID=A0A6A5UWT2_9PLEO|nr:hypothetical protein BU23DRAFT_572350 [Bimuria novae-zelandiae CBS 107.79]